MTATLRHQGLKAMKLLLLGTLCLWLSGCGGSAPPIEIDPSLVEGTLTTDPSPPVAGEPAQLRVQFSGAELTDQADVAVEIRAAGRPTLVDAEFDNGAFVGTHTFANAGTFEVYLHLYVDDLHIAKKTEVTVE